MLLAALGEQEQALARREHAANDDEPAFPSASSDEPQHRLVARAKRES
jgi:hypothetical protein